MSDTASSEMSRLHSLSVEQGREIERLQARVRELEKAPDLGRVMKAHKLFESEYVGQSARPLWEWAWEQAALQGNSDG